MFDRATFQQLTDAVESDLVEGHFHNALKLLGETLESELTPAMQHEVSSIQADYDRLLHYMAEGSEDSSRESLYIEFVCRTFRLLQELRHEYRQEHAQENINDYFAFLAHEMKGKWQILFDKNIDSLKQTQNFNSLDVLFQVLWVSAPLDSDCNRKLCHFLASTDTNTRSYLLSALSLALLIYFDMPKMRILLEYARSKDRDEGVRALVGIWFSTQLYSRVVKLYPDLWCQFEDLAKEKEVQDHLLLLQHHLCLYKESEQLHQKIEKEILPVLINASRERAKLGFDNDMEIDIMDPHSGLNLSKETRKRIDESAKTMLQMLQEGVDVNLRPFTALKSFPFFHSIGHWLAPFDEDRPEVPDFPLIKKLRLCDSDRYSLCLLMGKMPNGQLDDLSKMFNEHSEEIEMQMKEMPVSPVQNIIQCLYRLLKRSLWQSTFPDIFSADTLLIHHPLFGEELRKNPEFLRTTGETLLRYERYEEAEEHFLLLSEMTGTNSELFCQLGYCEQQLGRFPKAVFYYRQADFLVPKNSSTLFHLQYCYAHQGKYEEQLECLLQLEKLMPDDTKVTTETGLCLMQLHSWEEAQKRFFQLEVQGKRVLPSLRAIAWCALRMKDYELAQRYYDRILGEELARTKWEDFLNAGHIAWIRGNVSSALTLYHEYARRYAAYDPEAKDILAPYNQDVPILLENGKSLNEVHLMYDLIAREL